ncbi:isoprenylcysteine carboxylmethyltransferase family protein [Nonomuraea sp. NPDC049486]|jgi:protein-S-isoprenylcysteine O-methyltransferase Ste14|uniref:methyltransferase family protein n=1 Tax=unclassified Nonomuraea TaxID=2593643 RepID=UPI0011CEB173|nr:isoprenylcysteine carboxylmethyltransferase family protein [Nonomuraea sp. C10]TXK41314.1 isoprenylcysteine carboxylmethyltransferase family protein [Nonomuraea sp. C10]
MRRTSAAIGSAIFFLAAPGVVAGLGPWWVSGWEPRSPLPGAWMIPLRVAGVLLLLAGAAVVVDAFVRFVAEGSGTPAPIAAPGRLVVGGLYRHVRNPMYVGVLAAILGQALLFGDGGLLVYAAVAGAAMGAFAHWYEEPRLLGRFGADYERYRRAVPGWWPRVRPYHP